MTADIPLRCTCGDVRGVAKDVSGKRGNRLICMCDDCQAYAHWLGRAGELLDAHGGTDIFQMTPQQLKITEGTDKIRCLRLTPKGLLRWHTDCCKTPVGNTLSSAKVAFVGIPHLFMDHGGDNPSRDDSLGPIRAKIQGRFCKGEMPADAFARAPIGLILRFIKQLARGWLRGTQSPSPFFDATTGKPVASATVLTRDQRAQLRTL